ncbi:UNVERIFIED_CONTAM: hypothetical protein FKN15_013016 [Acipenser sinensis]
MKLKSHCTFFQTLSSIAWKRKSGPQCRLWSSDRPTAPLGARILTDPKKVFEHNMWDHVQWSHQEKEDARKKAIGNSCVQIPLEERDKYDKEAGKYWDEFYKTHQNKFFKDRNWLFFEFPELLSHRREGFGVEEGQCNVAVPSSKSDLCNSKDPQPVHSERFSAHSSPHTEHRGGVIDGAVSSCGDSGRNNETWKKMKTSPELLSHRREGFGVEEGQCNVAVPASKSDLCNSKDPQPVQSERFSAHSSPHTEHRGGVIDGAVSSCGDSGRNNETWKKMKTSPGSEATFRIFEVGCGAGNNVFPIVNALKMQGVVNRLTQLLKPGGTLLFRDYGGYDLSQLRFKRGRCLSENFYVRGDGTCVYFFTKDEVHNLFSNAGLNEIQNLEDRRLQVNRGKGVVMRQVWMQSKYHKPLAHSDP